MLFYLQTDFLPGWRPVQNYGHTLDSGWQSALGDRAAETGEVSGRSWW